MIGLIGGKLFKKFIVLDFNDLIGEYTMEIIKINKNNFKAKIILMIQKIIIKNVNILIVITSYIKKYAINIGVKDDKIKIIPNGVDIRLFNPNIKGNLSYINDIIKDKKICMYTGRIDTWAGINIIQQLSNKFRNDYPEILFVLIGSENDLVQNFSNLIVFKKIQYEDIPKFLSFADVILVPFPERDFTHAASPLKLFEAMAMGKPVIASGLSGIKEIISHLENGVLIDSNDINEWYDAVLFILNSNSSSKKMGENARYTVEQKYNWDLLSQEYDNFIMHNYYMNYKKYNYNYKHIQY